MSRKTRLNITVPAHLVDRVQEMIAQMELNGPEPEIKREEDYIEPVECIVKKVLEHRVIDGKYIFLLQFSDGDRVWVDDKDCNCESLIREYFRHYSLAINTIYCVCRVSSKSQSGDDHVSLDMQASRLLEAVTHIQTDYTMRVKVVKIVGTAFRQVPAVLKEIADVCQRGDIMAFYRVDRLSRNIEHIMGLLGEIRDKGVEIYSHHEDLWFDTEANRLKVYERILQAQQESQAISERVQSSISYRMQRGDQSLGSVPYGKKLVPENPEDRRSRKVIRDNHGECQIIEWILQQPLNDTRAGTANIARQLNARGNLKRGRLWSSIMVYNIVRKHRKERQ